MTATTTDFVDSPSPSSPRRFPPAPSIAWLQRIAIVSTARADSGIYRPLLGALAAQSRWNTTVLVGGNHHSVRFGNSAHSIPRLKGANVISVRHFVDGDRSREVAQSTGQAVIEFSNALENEKPDLVFVLGDRTEMLAAALAALIHTIPIAHLHGGDTTLGAYDEQCRHAITKLSHLHFPALPEHACRIEAMGEAPWRIHAVGSLALDALRDFKPKAPAQLAAHIGVDMTKPTILVVFHPETLSPLPPSHQVDELLSALRNTDHQFLLIGPNADVGHAAIDERMRGFASAQPGRSYISSLTPEDFWSALTHARALVGNSSAGILEAASFRLPVVNIGRRQAGRHSPGNVIHAELQTHAIKEAMQKALAPAFRSSLAELSNPYGDGQTAGRILSVLHSLPPRDVLLQKK